MHSLLSGALDVLSTYVPSLSADLASAGAPRVDYCQDVRFHHFGVWKRRVPSTLLGTLQTRPLLESVLRCHVARLGNVELSSGCRVTDLSWGADRERVGGVVVLEG